MAPARRVIVVGPGAVGSIIGGALAAAGADVTLLRRTARPDDGPGALRIEEPDESVREVPVERLAADAPVDGEPDLVVVAVKLFDLDAALVTAHRWPDAPLMTVQNGVGAEAAAADARRSPILAGSLTAAVAPIPGGVRRLRRGGIAVASVRDADAVAGWVAEALGAGGLPATVLPDAAGMKWSKLIANLVGNATSALLDMDPRAIYANRHGYAIERAQLLEAARVVRALGHEPSALPGAHVALLLRAMALPPLVGPVVGPIIGRARGGKSPSLRLHVRGGVTGPTEVGWLNGAVAREGARLGIPTPVNAALARLVDEAASEPSLLHRFDGRPAVLAAALAATQTPV